MRISHATRSAAPGRVNEDLAVAGADWAAVLDGATPAPGAGSGCVHGVPWLVGRLAEALNAQMTGPRGLADILAGAIGETRDAHAATCDLASPDSPSSTVSIVRARDDTLEYLVLCDSPVLLAHSGGQLTLVADDRLAHLPGGMPYSAALIRAQRNKPGGFWVASTEPDAAYQAVHGTVSLASVTDAALLTDGVTRLADWYGYSWQDILARLRDSGPARLIEVLRAAEGAYPPPGAKQHDDATVIHCRI